MYTYLDLHPSITHAIRLVIMLAELFEKCVPEQPPSVNALLATQRENVLNQCRDGIAKQICVWIAVWC